LMDSIRLAYSDMDVFVGLFILLVNLPIVLYKPLMEYFFNGQTLGRMALGIRMVRANGDRMTIKDIFVRWVMRGEFFWISLVSNPGFIGGFYLTPSATHRGYDGFCDCHSNPPQSRIHLERGAE